MTTSAVPLLMNVGRLIRSRMEKELPLPFSQCEALRVVADGEVITMRDVASQFKISAPSATSLVGELVDAGYVTRVGNPDDRREVHIEITEKGKRVHRDIAEARAKVIGSLLSVLGEKDIAELKRILTNIIQHN